MPDGSIRITGRSTPYLRGEVPADSPPHSPSQNLKGRLCPRQEDQKGASAPARSSSRARDALAAASRFRTSVFSVSDRAASTSLAGTSTWPRLQNGSGRPRRGVCFEVATENLLQLARVQEAGTQGAQDLRPLLRR